MLLLNLMRVLLTLVGLVVLQAFRQAYGLEGITLIVVFCLVLFIVFMLGDLAEEAMINYFNPEETDPRA